MTEHNKHIRTLPVYRMKKRVCAILIDKIIPILSKDGIPTTDSLLLNEQYRIAIKVDDNFVELYRPYVGGMYTETESHKTGFMNLKLFNKLYELEQSLTFDYTGINDDEVSRGLDNDEG